MTTQGNGSNSMYQGRIIWGSGSSLFEGKAKTEYNTGAPVLDQLGNPKVEYGFGLAIPKMNPATGQHTEEYVKIWQALNTEALTLYPSGQLPPDFAMKFKDGDGIDHNGKPFADREGYAGHIILTCTTQIPIKFFKWEGGNNVVINDGIKVGDYVNVQLNIKAHPAKGNGKAGLYLNPSAVQLIQAGKEIINAPSGDQLFGQTMPNYAGQVVADTAPTMPNAMGQAQVPSQLPPTMGQAPQTAPQMPQNGMQQAPAAPQQAPAAPNYAVIPDQHQPQQQAPTHPGDANYGLPPQNGTQQAPMGNPAGHAPPMNVPMGNGGMNPAAGTPVPNAMNTTGPQMPGMPQ